MMCQIMDEKKQTMTGRIQYILIACDSISVSLILIFQLYAHVTQKKI